MADECESCSDESPSSFKSSDSGSMPALAPRRKVRTSIWVSYRTGHPCVCVLAGAYVTNAFFTSEGDTVEIGGENPSKRSAGITSSCPARYLRAYWKYTLWTTYTCAFRWYLPDVWNADISFEDDRAVLHANQLHASDNIDDDNNDSDSQNDGDEVSAARAPLPMASKMMPLLTGWNGNPRIMWTGCNNAQHLLGDSIFHPTSNLQYTVISMYIYIIYLRRFIDKRCAIVLPLIATGQVLNLVKYSTGAW